MTLTEQWKKGELPYGYYYIKTISGGEVIDRYYRDCTDYDLCEYGDVWENRFEDEIIEVLAPVPNYVKWKALNEGVNTMTELWKQERSQLNEKIQLIGKLTVQVVDLKEENKQLKELLLECREWVEFLKAKMKLEKNPKNAMYFEVMLLKMNDAIGEKK